MVTRGRAGAGESEAESYLFRRGFSNVGNVTLVGGDTAGTYMAHEQAVGLTARFESVKSATGVDLGAILQGQAFGRGRSSSREAQSQTVFESNVSRRHLFKGREMLSHDTMGCGGSMNNGNFEVIDDT